MIKVYHGTNIKGIKELLPSYGRFGYGVYFTRDLEEAKSFGEYMIEVDIDKEKVRKIYYKDLIYFDQNLSISEEEGLTNLRDFIKDDIVEIIYEDETSEIVFYKSIKISKYQ